VESIALAVTSKAVEKINNFLSNKQPMPLGIRIVVYQELGGVNHSLSFVEELSSSDIVFDVDGITFVTDAHSSLFLDNMILDFVTLGNSSGFVFQNNCSATNRSCLNCNGSCYGRKVQ
jgi:iron-sulfur cluster assembly protein